MAIAIYYRVSTSQQETDAQKHEIDRWIEEQGYSKEELWEYSDKGISGSHSNRSGFQKLLKDIKANNIEKLITFEMSRLSRDFMTFLKVLELCEKKGVEIEVPYSDKKEFSTAKDKLLRSIEAFMATQEREEIGRRISAGMKNAKTKGKDIGAKKGEQRKLGYRKDYSASEPELVRQAFKLRKDGLSTHRIAEILGTNQSKVARILRRQC